MSSGTGLVESQNCGVTLAFEFSEGSSRVLERVLCNDSLFVLFFPPLSEPELKCLLLSARGSQPSRDAESSSRARAVGEIVGPRAALD